MSAVEFMGFEIEPYDQDGVWYAKVRKKGGKAFIAGVTSGTLLFSETPADTEVHAVEMVKSLIASGQVSG